jgi:hypothetical protein
MLHEIVVHPDHAHEHDDDSALQGSVALVVRSLGNEVRAEISFNLR